MYTPQIYTIISAARYDHLLLLFHVRPANKPTITMGVATYHTKVVGPSPSTSATFPHYLSPVTRRHRSQRTILSATILHKFKIMLQVTATFVQMSCQITQLDDATLQNCEYKKQNSTARCVMVAEIADCCWAEVRKPKSLECNKIKWKYPITEILN